MENFKIIYGDTMKNTFHNLIAFIFCFVVFYFFAPININAQWVLIDSTSFIKLVPVGEKCYVSVLSSTNNLQVTLPSDNLTSNAETAIGIAPDWLKMDLRDNFRALDSAHQDLYSGLIINAVSPYIDEICFIIAHTAPQTLTSNMNPQIITENVTSLYANDSCLSYVDIVDSTVGGDYFSTTVYKVLEQGNIHQYVLPREIYYWYIVHPKLHKEIPNYIDPLTGFPANPPTGVFWRDYLMNHNDAGYPLLRSCLDTCTVLWKGEQNTVDNGAVGVLTQWIKDVMTFQSNPHHNQPVRIYKIHIGTCSVHSYLTSAAARSALIPTLVDVMYSNNHKINEFWDRRWIAWEPVNTFIDNPGGYENWGWYVATAFNWRGDGFIWDATERYTQICTLNVNVTDSSGKPVDGARIQLYSSPCVAWGATAGWTIFNGQKQFLLGDNRTYSAYVTSGIGNYPSTGLTNVITTSGIGVTYTWNATLPGNLPVLNISPDTLPPTPTDDYRIVLDYNLPREILYGHNFDDNNRFSEPNSPGHIDFFICDSSNFNNYNSNQSFQAFEINQNSSNDTIDFVLPTSGSWYAVFSNECKMVLTEELHVIAKLYQNSTGIEPGTNNLPLTFALHQNYPNPFNPVTYISFDLPKKSLVKLTVFDILGREVSVIVNEVLNAGSYTADWPAANYPSGIYFYRIQTDNNYIETRKMLLIK